MVWLVLAGLAGAGVVVLLYASLIERRWYAVRTHTVPCLPPGSDPLTLLHVSDLHLRAPQKKKIAFLRDLARFHPDIVVGTGDFLGDPNAVPATLHALEPLRGRIASLFVLGSNDYYSPVPRSPLKYFKGPSKPRVKSKQNPWPDLVAGLRANGWELVANRALAAGSVDVVGLDDPHINRADLDVATRRTAEGFRLAVVHSPEPIRELAALGYDLIVSGHTHGGQIRMPVYGAIVTNTEGLPRKMVRGLHPLGDSYVHVSAGLGTSMYAPVRFACRPEVCVLRLVPRDTRARDQRAATTLSNTRS